MASYLEDLGSNGKKIVKMLATNFGMAATNDIVNEGSNLLAAKYTEAQILNVLFGHATIQGSMPKLGPSYSDNAFVTQLIDNYIGTATVASVDRTALITKYVADLGTAGKYATRGDFAVALQAAMTPATAPTAGTAEAIIATSLGNRVEASAYYAQNNSTFVSMTAAKAAVAAVTDSAASLTTATTKPATPLVLTTGTDNLVGPATDDTITGAAGTWGTGDTVNGGTGTDTFSVVISGTAPTQSATTLVGVEVLNLTASPQPATLNLTGVTGLTAINNLNSASGATVAVTEVAATVNTTLTNATSTTSVLYATAATNKAGTADAATLTLSGVSAGSGFTTANIEAVTINSITSANQLDAFSDPAMTSLTITGDKNLTLGTLGTDGFQTAVGNSGQTVATATYNASAATGTVNFSTGNGAGAPSTGGTAVGVTVTAPTATTGTFTVKTGSNNDLITLGGGSATVMAGAGNDTIVGGAGNSLITAGAGNDTLTLGAGVETLRFDAAAASTNADTINGFDIAKDVLSFNLGSTSVSGAASTPVFGVLATVATGATAPTASTIGTVAGTGTTTAFAASQFVTVSGGVATANTIPQTAAIVALNGALTDGTAAGVVTALGTTGTTGVTTTTNGKFLLVTYSVGNVAQVWSYTGDVATAGTGSVLTDIDAAELSLVATLNNVSANSLTATNFSAYTAAAASTAASTTTTGQTITINTALNTVNTTANTAGQYFTAAADTVNVALGSLPTAAQSATAGLTLLDSTTGDGDIMNASVLNAAWNTGTVLTNIENVNLTMLVSDSDGFAWTSTMPGTTTVTFLGTNSANVGTQSGTTIATTGITNVLSGSAIGFGASYNGTVNLTQGSTLTALTLNLGGNTPTAGSIASSSPRFNSGTLITTLTVNAQAGSTINSDAETGIADATNISNTSFFNATTTNFTGSGNVTLVGSAAQFDGSRINASTAVSPNTVYSGALTIMPTVVGNMNFSGTGASSVTGIRTIDLTLLPAWAVGNLITINAANNSAAYGASGAVNVAFSPSSASALAGLGITADGTAATDSLAVSLNATATGITNGITATGYENLTLSVAAASTIGGISFGGTAQVNTQALTVNSSSSTGAVTLGTITGADTINTTGVAGTVSLTVANGGTVGTTFTGGAGNTIITTTENTVLNSFTTGAGNDTINMTTTTTGGGVYNGGAGNDTYALNTATGALTISDPSGTDTLLFAGNGNTTNVNIGGVATLALAGIEQFVMASGSTLTVAPGQFAGGTGTFNTVATGGVFNVTLGTAGVLNLSGIVGTAIPVASGYQSAAGVTTAGIAVTAMTLTGTATADTITGSSTIAETIIGLAGADAINPGASTSINDTIKYTATAQTGATIASGGSTTSLDIITGAGTGDIIDLAFAVAGGNFAATTIGTTIAGVTAEIEIIRGIYSTTAFTFTSDGAGNDSILVFDNNGGAAGTTYEAIVLVGYNGVGATATVGGIVTL